MGDDSMAMDVHEAICALTDPFCPQANGVRLPDGANVRSMPYQLHARIAFSIDGNGNGGFLICPGYLYQVAQLTFASAPTATCAAFTASLNGTAMAATSTRIINWGVVLRNTGPALTASGTWRIRGFANQVGTNLLSVNTGNYNVDWAEDHPMAYNPEIHVKGHRFNAATSNNYVTTTTTNPTANVTDWANPGWQAVMIACFDADGVNGAAEAELFISYELAFDDGDAMATVCKPSLPDNFPLRQAQSHVEAAAGSTHTTRANYDRVLKELATKAAKKVGHKAIKEGMSALTRAAG